MENVILMKMGREYVQGERKLQKTTLYIDADLYRQVKMFCVANDVKITDFLGEAIREYLKKQNTGGGK